MLFTVFLQITPSGLTSSTFGSFDAFWKRASLDIFIPGAIVPPRYSFFSEIAQNVVAVPKSTITHGPPYLCMHATAFTILSAPTCLGLSYFILIPVLIPGPTTSASLSKYFMAICCNEYIMVGTTEDMITSSISSVGIH